MATLTINFTEVIPNPINGYIIKYRVKGSGVSYTTLSPNRPNSPVVIMGLPSSTEYEGTIASDCGSLISNVATFNTCTCPVGYSVVGLNQSCIKLETIAPTVLFSNYCLAASTENAYSAYATRIYNPGFSNASIVELTPVISTDVYAELFNAGLWVRTGLSDGPLNRCGVWIDSDCDGVKDSVTPGVETTIATIFNNAGSTRTIHIGVAGDNSFDLVVNGVHVATSPNDTSPLNFNIWHIFPVVVNNGINNINLVAVSGGGVDAVGMTIYDNTAAQIVAATTLASLTIPFSTESLRGNTIDIATCPATYSLDTSAGVGLYICRRTLTSSCIGV
jgi:hypothetical protein